jgi:hypothetical protein
MDHTCTNHRLQAFRCKIIGHRIVSRTSAGSSSNWSFFTVTVSAAAIALKQEGDLSGVIDTRFGLHVLKLFDRLPPHVLPFDDKLKGEIVVRLDHRRQEEATLGYVAALKKKAQVQIWETQ